MTPTYSEKLKDPRWQKRRLEILQRDQWTCQRCGDLESTLHVHHRFYNGEPWEAPDHALITYCAECHASETELWAAEGRALLRQLAENTHFDASDLSSLMCAIHGMAYTDHPNIIWATIEAVLMDPSIQKVAVGAYQARQATRRKERRPFPFGE